jgi:hypothetical protein
MNPENYLEVFRMLVALALDYRYREGVCNKGIRATEPAFFALLMYVKHAPLELQKLTEPEFIKMIQIPGRAHELVGYCMRDLKFLLVKEAVHQLHESIENKGGGFQNRRTLEKILAAYEVEWRGDAAYTYHSRKHGQNGHSQPTTVTTQHDE